MKQIKDITSMKEIEYQLKGIEDLLNNKSLLKKSGMNPLQIAKLRSDYSKSKKEFEEISVIPDKFNDIFSDHGWLAFENLNLNLMKKVVELAESSGIAEAEKELVNYYSDEKTINLISHRLFIFPEFMKRQHLYKTALERHFSGDFISSVPLFLMIIDGFVNDIEQTGFFSENTNLVAWDSIAAHEKGLKKVAALLNRGRNRTTTEPIEFPYRHGILHGRDLNYGHAIVSTKALNIIFSLSDWASAKKRMKEGLTKEKYSPPTIEETSESILDTFEKHKELKLHEESLNQWKNREYIIGIDIPFYGESTDYEENSPEKSMVQLIEYINNENFGKIAEFVNLNSKDFSFKTVAGEMRKILADFKISTFKLIKVEDKAPALTVITIELTFLIENSTEYVTEETFRWIATDDLGETISRNHKTPNWKIAKHPFYKWETFKFI